MLTTGAVLDTQPTPVERQRAGKIIASMRLAHYTADQTKAVCHALFVKQSDEDMAAAWDALMDQRPVVDKRSFRALLTLLGDGAIRTPQMIELFGMIDRNQSGAIERSEFDFLLRQMVPKSKEARLGGVYMFLQTNSGGLAPPPVDASFAADDDAVRKAAAGKPTAPPVVSTTDITLRQAPAGAPVTVPARPPAAVKAAAAQTPAASKAAAVAAPTPSASCCVIS
jgi:hypothetical protein